MQILLLIISLPIMINEYIDYNSMLQAWYGYEQSLEMNVK